jgi:hypothetical protein
MRARSSILFLPILMMMLCNGSGTAADASEPAHAAPTQPEPLQDMPDPLQDAPEPLQDALGPDANRTGRDIYQCVLDNRFDSYVQHSKLLSGDRGGAVQASQLRMTWSSLRDPDGEPSEGVLSKTIVKYLDPFDLRFSGYLIINNHARKNDQFVYLATTRRIRRVNLRREAVFGTDFTFEDLVPREIEDGDYQRLPDKVEQDTTVYVVEVIPRDHADSEYSRFVIYVDKTSCVPLLTRYWDKRDLLVKELTAPAANIEQVQGIYWPNTLTMRNLHLETFTTLTVEGLDPNPKLARKTFDLRRLESH